MGLHVSIHRSDYDSTLNAFYGKRTVTVVNIDGPFEPTDDAPAALLDHNAFGSPIIVPLLNPDGQVGPMMGGTYAATSDSRFREAIERRFRLPHFYGALAVHDRYETPALYEAMSR